MWGSENVAILTVKLYHNERLEIRGIKGKGARGKAQEKSDVNIQLLFPERVLSVVLYKVSLRRRLSRASGSRIFIVLQSQLGRPLLNDQCTQKSN